MDLVRVVETRQDLRNIDDVPVAVIVIWIDKTIVMMSKLTAVSNATLFTVSPSFKITLKSQSIATYIGLNWPPSDNSSLFETATPHQSLSENISALLHFHPPH